MSEPTDRFVIEIKTGTVAHIIDTDADQSETDSGFSLGLSGPGEKMCNCGNRQYSDAILSLSSDAIEKSETNALVTERYIKSQIV